MTKNVDKRAEERFVRKTARISAKYLRLAKEMNNAPESMSPFWDILDDVYVKNRNIYTGLAAKTVGTYCVMVPEELVYNGRTDKSAGCKGYTSVYLSYIRGYRQKMVQDKAAH